MNELIDKIRAYMEGNVSSEFKKSLVEGEISRLQTGQQSPDTFKVGVSVILGINVNNL